MPQSIDPEPAPHAGGVWIALALLSLGTSPAAAQGQAAEPMASAPFAADRLASGALAYRVLVQGRPMGQSAVSIERMTEGGRPALRLTASTIIGSSVQFTDSILMDAAALAPIRIRQNWTSGGQQGSVALDYDGMHVKGHVHVPQHAGVRDTGVRDADVDTTLAPGTFDALQMTRVLPALPLASRGRWTVRAYTGGDGVVRTLTVSVSGGESVTVPAGTFDCWKVQLSGGQMPTDLYITKAAPYLLVRYAQVGSPLVTELTQHLP
jgi:hypothetical protein